MGRGGGLSGEGRLRPPGFLTGLRDAVHLHAGPLLEGSHLTNRAAVWEKVNDLLFQSWN